MKTCATCGNLRRTCECNCEDCFKYGLECAKHGEHCGACGAYITETAQKGDGQAMYHKRDEDCRAVKALTF